MLLSSKNKKYVAKMRPDIPKTKIILKKSATFWKSGIIIAIYL